MQIPDFRNHMTLVQDAYRERLAKIPARCHEPWVFLKTENLALAALAKEHGWGDVQLNCNIMENYLQTFLDSSPSVDGFLTEKIVEAMKGDQPPEQPSPAAGLDPDYGTE